MSAPQATFWITSLLAKPINRDTILGGKIQLHSTEKHRSRSTEWNKALWGSWSDMMREWIIVLTFWLCPNLLYYLACTQSQCTLVINTFENLHLKENFPILDTKELGCTKNRSCAYESKICAIYSPKDLGSSQMWVFVFVCWIAATRVWMELLHCATAPFLATIWPVRKPRGDHGWGTGLNPISHHDLFQVWSKDPSLQGPSITTSLAFSLHFLVAQVAASVVSLPS